MKIQLALERAHADVSRLASELDESNAERERAVQHLDTVQRALDKARGDVLKLRKKDSSNLARIIALDKEVATSQKENQVYKEILKQFVEQRSLRPTAINQRAMHPILSQPQSSRIPAPLPSRTTRIVPSGPHLESRNVADHRPSPPHILPDTPPRTSYTPADDITPSPTKERQIVKPPRPKRVTFTRSIAPTAPNPSHAASARQFLVPRRSPAKPAINPAPANLREHETSRAPAPASASFPSHHASCLSSPFRTLDPPTSARQAASDFPRFDLPPFSTSRQPQHESDLSIDDDFIDSPLPTPPNPLPPLSTPFEEAEKASPTVVASSDEEDEILPVSPKRHRSSSSSSSSCSSQPSLKRRRLCPPPSHPAQHYDKPSVRYMTANGGENGPMRIKSYCSPTTPLPPSRPLSTLQQSHSSSSDESEEDSDSEDGGLAALAAKQTSKKGSGFTPIANRPSTSRNPRNVNIRNMKDYETACTELFPFEKAQNLCGAPPSWPHDDKELAWIDDSFVYRGRLYTMDENSISLPLDIRQTQLGKVEDIVSAIQSGTQARSLEKHVSSLARLAGSLYKSHQDQLSVIGKWVAKLPVKPSSSPSKPPPPVMTALESWRSILSDSYYSQPVCRILELEAPATIFVCFPSECQIRIFIKDRWDAWDAKPQLRSQKRPRALLHATGVELAMLMWLRGGVTTYPISARFALSEVDPGLVKEFSGGKLGKKMSKERKECVERVRRMAEEGGVRTWSVGVRGENEGMPLVDLRFRKESLRAGNFAVPKDIRALFVRV